MNRRALISCVVSLAVTFTSGCMFTTQALSGVGRTYRTVDFHVIDAETNQPLASAVLHVEYQGMAGLIPRDVAGRTNRDGHVKLRVSRGDNAYLRVEADGYVDTPENAQMFKPSAKQEIRVYRLPLPYHVLELPVGGRGEYRIVLASFVDADRKFPRDWNGWKPGQRELVTRLESGAAVHLRGLPKTGGRVPERASIRGARFADGTPLPLWYPADPFDRELSPAPGDTRMTGMSPRPGDTFALWLIGHDSSLH